MKLSQKIKHYKRHRQNKRFAKFADNVYFAATECFLNGNTMKLIISSRLYHVINVRKGHVPKNIKNTNLVSDTNIITVPTEVIDTNDRLDYIKEWCGIPKGVDIPFTPGSERVEYLREQPNEETVNQLSNIPLGQFVNPELYMGIDKSIALDICTLNGVRV